MKLRLTEKDIEVLTFLRNYKIMLAADTKRIYKSKDYNRKRLKILEKEKYIKRVGRYIKLDINGVNLMREFRYEYSNVCRSYQYRDRLKEIVRIATQTISSSITFIPSWEIKNSNIFTEKARKYIGELNYQEKNAIAYYISKDKPKVYISQIINDIQKAVEHNNIIVFMEDMKALNKRNQYFMFGKTSTLIVKANSKNLEKMRLLQTLDYYEILARIYKKREILLSNWEKADYMTNKKEYIIFMPFIDTEKLHRLNIFYRNNKSTSRRIDIITLKENKQKVEEILSNKTNIIELDNYLGGINVE